MKGTYKTPCVERTFPWHKHREFNNNVICTKLRYSDGYDIQEDKYEKAYPITCKDNMCNVYFGNGGVNNTCIGTTQTISIPNPFPPFTPFSKTFEIPCTPSEINTPCTYGFSTNE